MAETTAFPDSTPASAVMPPPRLRSLDALRGFDMFWIVGGQAIVLALATATDWPPLHAVAHQLKHVEWHGFSAWDLIFPLFLFLAGVAMPLSLTRRLERGDSRRELNLHVIRRGLVLVLLGVIYNGLLTFDFATLRYASVLGRIGLGYMFAGLIVLRTGLRGQCIAIVAILLGYWAMLMLVPVPGHGAGNLAPGATLTDWVDRQLLPGRLHRGVRDPEGILSTLPAVATALLGALAGSWLRRDDRSGERKAALLLASGAACLAAGALWNTVLPINKNLWTSSFVLWTGGWSFLLLGVFYLLIDVRGIRFGTTFFTVIGANAITIYLMQRFIDFDAIANLVFERDRVHAVLFVAAGLALKWLVLYWMYRRRVFLRV